MKAGNHEETGFLYRGLEYDEDTKDYTKSCSNYNHIEGTDFDFCELILNVLAVLSDVDFENGYIYHLITFTTDKVVISMDRPDFEHSVVVTFQKIEDSNT